MADTKLMLNTLWGEFGHPTNMTGTWQRIETKRWQKTAYEITTRLVGSEMCIRDSSYPLRMMGSLSVYKNRAPRLPTTNHGRAMDSICMVIDLEGFQLSKHSGAAFLVREFGWCKWDRTLTGNTHFDHGWRWRDLSKKDQRTVSHAIDRVHGLSFKPGTHEHSLPVSTLPDLVMELHSCLLYTSPSPRDA